jgi:hypothetical protein
MLCTMPLCALEGTTDCQEDQGTEHIISTYLFFLALQGITGCPIFFWFPGLSVCYLLVGHKSFL